MEDTVYKYEISPTVWQNDVLFDINAKLIKESFWVKSERIPNGIMTSLNTYLCSFVPLSLDEQREATKRVLEMKSELCENV